MVDLSSITENADVITSIASVGLLVVGTFATLQLKKLQEAVRAMAEIQYIRVKQRATQRSQIPPFDNRMIDSGTQYPQSGNIGQMTQERYDDVPRPQRTSFSDPKRKKALTELRDIRGQENEISQKQVEINRRKQELEDELRRLSG